MATAFQQGDLDPLLQFSRLYSRIERRVRERPIPIGELRPDPDLLKTRTPASFPKRTMKPLERKPVAAQPAPSPEPVREQLPSYLREDSRPVALGVQATPSPNVTRAFIEPDPDDTARVDPAALEKAQGVPFSPDSPAAVLARIREDAARKRAQTETPRPTQALEERGTMALPEGETPSGAPLPFEDISPSAVDLSMFPIERYAEISVTLSKSDDRAKVLRRFVLTEGMWRAVTQAWAARINEDPRLRAGFHAAVERARRNG